MRLTTLFQDIDCQISGADVEVQKIEYDSRKVQKGDLFACVVGMTTDGHEYAQSAIEKGAAALLVERLLPINIPQVQVENSRKAMALAACRYYDFPARKMKMCGVTGTNGKTTTTYMLKSIAEAAGDKAGLVGTISTMIGNESIPAERTTPESVDLQAILANMVQEGVKICCMEVSSHALEQYRVEGIEFDVAVFTNLTQDHLDYHKTFENYRQAKRKLFAQSKAGITNLDDEQGSWMLEGQKYPSCSFGIREDALISAKDIDITTHGVSFDMLFANEPHMMHVALKIPGLFSVYNAMGAAAAAMLLGYQYEQIKEGLESLDFVSGRLENLPTGKQPFSVLLDYAHTPDALENVLKTVRGFAQERVITLFGCGGNRDAAKRAIMGETAGRYSDLCILTSDNPRDEEPMDIIAMAEEGIKKSGCEYIVIENRQEAIAYAMDIAKEKDVILLAGKGHETYQEIKGVKRHFDEKEIVAQLIEGMDSRSAQKEA